MAAKELAVVGMGRVAEVMAREAEWKVGTRRKDVLMMGMAAEEMAPEAAVMAQEVVGKVQEDEEKAQVGVVRGTGAEAKAQEGHGGGGVGKGQEVAARGREVARTEREGAAAAPEVAARG